MRVTPPVSEDDAHFHALPRVEADIPIIRKVDIPFRGGILDGEPPPFDFSDCFFPKRPEVNLDHCDKSLCPPLD